MSHADLVTQAEMIWVLKFVQSNFSFSSAENIGILFANMFPKCEVAKDFQLARNKVSYTISHGLGPYFIEEVCQSVRKSGIMFFICFDETTTRQTVKQVDIHVCYIDGITSKVSVRYVTSLFLGHSSKC